MTLWFKRHMMPLVALVTFWMVMGFAWREAPGHLIVGTLLLLVYWLVEWRGIQGGFEGRVPRHWLIVISRALWVGGLIICLCDFLWLHWTPWQGLWLRVLGGQLFLAGIGLRYWSMRALAQAFSYDLKVSAGQRLVTQGPYRFVRHPSYTGLSLWSASFAIWNPSWPGLLILLLTTVPQILYRITFEEPLLEEHFGEQWITYARRTPALLPRIW